jgi:hypothetical protein
VLVEVNAAESHHGAVRHLDAAESVLAAEVDASAEVREGGAHATLRIGRIRQPAKCARFRFGRAQAPRIREAKLMLLSATVDLAKREKDVATEVMEAGEFAHETVALGFLLRRPEQLESFGKSLGDPQTLGESDLCLAGTHVVGRRGRLPSESAPPVFAKRSQFWTTTAPPHTRGLPWRRTVNVEGGQRDEGEHRQRHAAGRERIV